MREKDRQTARVMLKIYWLFRPRGEVRSIVMSMSVCLSVCLSMRITRKPHGGTSPIFCACCLWPWLGPPLTSCFRNMGQIKQGVMFRRVRQAAVPVGRRTTTVLGRVRRSAAVPGRCLLSTIALLDLSWIVHGKVGKVKDPIVLADRRGSGM